MIDDDAVSFDLYPLHSGQQLATAIAFDRMEDISRQALGMDAHKGRPRLFEISFDEQNEFVVIRLAADADDAKIPNFGRQIRLCDQLHAKFASIRHNVKPDSTF